MSNEELAERIRSGEAALLVPLWEQTERLIYKLAVQYCNGHALPAFFDLEDCIQCGFLALVRAVQSYDPEKGFKLTAYLWNHLRAVIRDELHTREPPQVCSYNVPLDADEELELIDTLPDEAAQEPFDRIAQASAIADLHRALEQCLAKLPEAERAVLLEKYWSGKTVRQIAQSQHRDQKEVRSDEDRAMRKLRRPEYWNRLRCYLLEGEAYHGNSLTAWRNTGCSGVERAVEKVEQLLPQSGKPYKT